MEWSFRLIAEIGFLSIFQYCYSFYTGLVGNRTRISYKRSKLARKFDKYEIKSMMKLLLDCGVFSSEDFKGQSGWSRTIICLLFLLQTPKALHRPTISSSNVRRTEQGALWFKWQSWKIFSLVAMLINQQGRSLTGVNSSWSRWRQVLSLEQVPFTVWLRATLRIQEEPGESRPCPLRLLRLLLLLLLLLLALPGVLFLLRFKSLLVLVLLSRTSSWSCWRMFVLVLFIPIWISLIELDSDSSWPLEQKYLG